MAALNVMAATGEPKIVLTSTATIVAGDLLYVTGGAFAKADATDATKPAEFIALNGNGGSSTARIAAVRKAQFYDEDAPYTAGSLLYLSTTAGGWTHTRPTTAGNLRQVVGKGITTKRAEVEISNPREVTVPWEFVKSTSASITLDTSGPQSHGSLDANAETAWYTQRVPENAIGVVSSVIVVATETEVGTITGAFTCFSAITDAQWDAVTQDTSESGKALEGSQADDFFDVDVSGALNATGIIKPGAALVLKVAQDSATTDPIGLYGGATTFKVV